MRLESGTSLQQEVGWSRDMVRMARYLADIQESPFLVCCLDNIQDELSTWTSLFPAVQPTVSAGCSPLAEVQQEVRQLGLQLQVRTRQELAAAAGASCAVYSSSTKLGSHIRAAAAAGVQLYYADTVAEMEKIRRLLPSARIIVELSAEDGEATDSLDSAPGIPVSDLGTILQEARRLELEVVGVALNLDVSGSLDHEANLGRVVRGLGVAEAAVVAARDCGVELRSVHLGQICCSALNLPAHFAADINTILARDVFASLRVSADASTFLVSSCVTLAAQITAAAEVAAKDPAMSYAVNESVFGAFSGNLAAPECCLTAPLVLGGRGGRRRGASGQLLDCAITGLTGSSLDTVVPLGDVVLPRMEAGDWLLFPDMGARSLSEYEASSRKIVGNKSFVCIRNTARSTTTTSKNPMGNFESVTSEKAAVNIDLDLQSTQSYNGAGLKGEIDLRKTFIYDEN